jgi:predicted signal transduction protein with EAL and GGDEF domain
LEIGASVGIALDASDGWQTLLARADKMVYEAKSKGRGRANSQSAHG